MPKEVKEKQKLKDIRDIAAKYKIRESTLELYGKHKAKISLSGSAKKSAKAKGKYIVVTALTPTPLGEGKTVTTIGTALGIEHLGKKALCCLRQPSMGPVFGIKGGSGGTAASAVLPSDEFNLHLTGDMHAVGAAHNLIAAAIDTRMFLERKYGAKKFKKLSGLSTLDIDPEQIFWRRVLDVNDRALRDIKVGLPNGGKFNDNGIPHHSGFDITAASELMAVLGLAENIQDLRRRIGRVVFAHDRHGHPITAEDLGVAGAAAALMKDAIKPTLMQTSEGTGVLVHSGPFANIAHGSSSIIADRIALQSADYVVTEAGFGADIGFEKFVNIKCLTSKLKPDAAVMVVTVRALKMHSGRFNVVPGKRLPKELFEENIEAIEAGLCNLNRHLENVRRHGLPVVVAVNSFPTDTKKELEFVRQKALEAGAFAAEISECWAKGGRGAKKLASAVMQACEEKSRLKYLYPDKLPLREKIETIATEIYRAKKVRFLPKAAAQLRYLEREGFGKLPVCMAKTQFSFSHEPRLKGAPEGFIFPVREVHVSAGAGFVHVLTGAIKTMPGFGSRPAYLDIDIDKDGNITGLH